MAYANQPPPSTAPSKPFVKLEAAVTDQASRSGGRCAVVDARSSLTYSELSSAADNLAQSLLHHGVGKGNVVICQLPNSCDFVVALLACQRIDATPAMLLMALGWNEIAQVASVLQPAAVITVETYRGMRHAAEIEQMFVRQGRITPVLNASGASRRRSLRAPLAASGSDRHMNSLGTTVAENCNLSDAVILLTGGTTGQPKLAPHTHQDYFHAANACAEVCNLSDQTVYLAALPAAHNFTLASPGLAGVLFAGGTVVFTESPNPERAFEAIHRHAVTMTAIVPSVARRWCDFVSNRENGEPNTLRIVQIGGSPTPPDLVRTVQRTLGTQVQQVYGMTEGFVCMTRLDDSQEAIESTQGRPASLEDTVLIVDADNRAVTDGRVGEVITKGPSTIRGYVDAGGSIDRTSFDSNGFYRTGDLGLLRDDGRLLITGRSKEIVNRGGEKISVHHVEMLLADVPGVKLAAAVALPHKAHGECVGAAVVAADGSNVAADEVRTWLVAKGVSKHLIPEVLIPVSDIPKTPMGKTDRPRLKQQLLSMLPAL